jgi:hypothetical protein
MTAEQVERLVEHQTDAIDAAFMAGRITQEEYDRKVRELDRWAEERFRRATPAKIDDAAAT